MASIFSWADWPIPNPTYCERQLVTNNARLQSSITQSVQTARRGGELHRMRCTWVNLAGSDRATLVGLLTALHGSENRIRLPVFGQQNYGALNGNPVLRNSHAAGENTLRIQGVPGLQLDWARPGDLLGVQQVDNLQHFVVTEGDNASSSGEVTIRVYPRLRFSLGGFQSVIVDADNDYQRWILLEWAPYDLRDPFASGDTASTITADFIEDVLPLP